MAGAVSVVLVSRGSKQDPIPERHIVLTRSAPVISIGRASKVPTKGFVPKADNAWFDNPVMSRKHAKLSAQFDGHKTPVSSHHRTAAKPTNGVD